MHPVKPTKTLADYLVVSISPVLIMLLVGSLSFFLVEVFFRGEAIGSVRWVMFWFVMAVVLVSRIGIEQGTGPAAGYGLALAAAVSQISRDATVVPVLRQVTPAIALALGGLVRRGFLVTAVVVAFERNAVPDWAQPPEWAGLLLAQGVDFRLVNSEESVMDLCTEAIVR